MSENGKIYEVVATVMSEIGAIGKNQRNAQQGFAYRGVDQVMNALSPLLSKHHLLIIPEVLDVKREERQTVKGGCLMHTIATVKYTFFAEDGSNVSAVVVGEGMDSGDKSASKAMSIAFKYACFQIFCISTEEMVDPDRESYDVAAKTRKINAKEQAILRETVEKCGRTIEQALAACHKESIDQITLSQYTSLIKQCQNAA